MKTIIIFFLSIGVFVNTWAKPPKKIAELLKTYAFIPAGKAKVENKELDVADFYIHKTEVSNLNYLQFLNDLKSKGNEENYQKALPDTTKWKFDASTYDSFTKYYLRYPGFRSYPAVAMSHDAASMYCKWLEDKLNKNLEGEAKVEVRLPTEAEWIRAARGDNHAYIFPWGGPKLQNGKGAFLGNFRKIGEENIKEENGDLEVPKTNTKQSKSTISISTTEVFAFSPNQFDISNLSGNVAEMLSEKGKTKGGSWTSTGYFLRIDASQNYPESSVAVGFRPVLILKN